MNWKILFRAIPLALCFSVFVLLVGYWERGLVDNVGMVNASTTLILALFYFFELLLPKRKRTKWASMDDGASRLKPDINKSDDIDDLEIH